MTQRIQPVDPNQAIGPAKELFDGIQSKIGMVPNIFRTMGQSAAILQGYLDFSDALGKGRLSGRLREQIALTVAGRSHCDYCASAHTAIAKGFGVSEEETSRNLAGDATDERTATALWFAAKLVDQRGNVSDLELETMRAAGFDDGEIVEIIANVAANLFTNYFNHVAGTEIDFPVVTTESIAA